MDRIYFLLLVTSFLQGYYFESIQSSYDNNDTLITEQMTTSTPNINSTQFPRAQWWDFDELKLGKPKTNKTYENKVKKEGKTLTSVKCIGTNDFICPIYLTPENADTVLQTLTLPSMQTLKRRRKPFSFTVEGIVGSGKSTLLSAFKVIEINLYYAKYLGNYNNSSIIDLGY